MRRIKETLLNISLRQKLILAFACFIVIPFLIIGGALSSLYMSSNRSLILDAAVANNKQIVKNIDTSLNPLLNLSMYPVQNDALFQMMRKDYTSLPYPLYDREKDFDTVGGMIRNSMMLYTDLIDSAVIYQSTNHLIIGRSNNDYMNHAYLDEGFYREPFVQAILQKNGLYVPVGIHDEKLLSFRPVPVVSIGRAIVDPYTKENLGFILFNIGVDKLKTLWSDIHFTDHTRFYLVDQNANVIYSKHSGDIGKPAAGILGGSFNYSAAPHEQLQQNSGEYVIASASKLSGWQAVTVIPKSELFGFVNVIVRTIAISLLVMLGLAIVISIYIATGITKPLLALQQKMKQVAQGDLDVTIDVQHGEIGRIGVTIDQMLHRIRELIRTIYEDEREKRQLEILALQAQIRPHFMYNTINAIKWMAKIQGATGIEEALTAFSSVIQFTAKTKSDFVTVREEVEFINNYTKILDIRYLNKFDVSFDIDPRVWEYETLKFLLQPLVENAIFHGFDGIPYKGKLSIQVREQAGDIVMTVTDNGRGMSKAQRDRLQQHEASDKLNSIGINNVRKRIELHFGKRYGLTITSAENAGTTAKIVVPVIHRQHGGEQK